MTVGGNDKELGEEIGGLSWGQNSLEAIAGEQNGD